MPHLVTFIYSQAKSKVVISEKKSFKILRLYILLFKAVD